MLAEKNKWKDKRKLQAHFCCWLHQNSLKTSTSEAGIWWSDHHKWVKQKELPNWSLLPATACQALSRHWQLPETAHHWSCVSAVTGVRGTAQLPSTVPILANTWSPQHSADPSLGAFATRAPCLSHSISSSQKQLQPLCCPAEESPAAFLPGTELEQEWPGSNFFQSFWPQKRDEAHPAFLW